MKRNLLSCQIFLFFLLAITASPATAQQKIDSILTAIEHEHSISRKASLYESLSLEYKPVDLNKSEKYARQALLLAENNEDKTLEGNICALLGDIAFLQDSIDKAENAYNRAIPLLSETGQFQKLLLVYIQRGNRLIEKGNYPQAMSFYLKGLRLSEEINDSTHLPKLYNNLGVVYLNMNNHKKALDYYSKALPLFEVLHDTMNVAGATANIGSIYIKMDEYDIARQYYLKGLEIFKSIHHLGGQAHVLFKLGLLDKMQQKYESALQNFFESKRFQEMNQVIPFGSKSMFLAETNIYIGITYFLLEDDKTAEEYLIQGLNVSKEGERAGMVSLASEYLSKIYKQKGDYRKALTYYTLFKSSSDSIFNEENIRKLAQLEMQYQFDVKLKEAEIQRIAETQKRKRLSLIYTIISVGLFLVLIIVALLLKLEKKKKKEVELERKRLADKLEYTNKELTTHVMYLLKKNEFILTIIEKLKKARLDASPENKKVMAELISELKSNTDTVSWEEFELRFQEVHTDFYSRLSQQFPDLSTNEIRMCAFFKLNMTSKEIAALTYQSLNSIKVARYRLRKKLRLEKEDNLVTFLNRL
jgi:tetratricopeptide (TPR) repeat protein